MPKLRAFVIIVSTTLLIHGLSSKVAAAAAANSSSERPWMDKSLRPVQRAHLLLKEMTLDEEITMVHGVDPIPMKAYVGYVPPNPRLGISALDLADGRAGVGNSAKNVTLLPAPIAAASAWDLALIHRYGQLLGQEQWQKGTNVALGPSIDVVRVPEWGRTFESYGEDPYFNGEMAAAEITGIQSQGPIANANMYLTMNQENNRFQEDSIVDERTLQEIYLPPFEAAVREGRVGTVMCAYVKTNGAYSCENAHLLNELLKTQLKFGGWVMSDWGATHSTVASVKNGLDQEMPDATFYGKPLKVAVESGQINKRILDEHVLRILATMFKFGLFDKPQEGTWTTNVRNPEHDAFSRLVAEKGTVLLKNDDDVLPLAAGVSVAIIGEAGSTKPKAEGGGSSGVVAPYIVSPLDGMRKRSDKSGKVSYADGKDLNVASTTARSADVAVVFVHTDETEGKDRPDLRLPGNQDNLVAAVAAANKKTIVVLDTGGPVLMPWIDRVSGVVEAWYPGQEDGNAVAAVLYGDFDPSGKLPLTFPRAGDAVPTGTSEQWPGVNGRSIYSEKLKVGYRWYDATGTNPLFPFGFGLSYTTFRLSDLAVTPERLVSTYPSDTQAVHAMVKVTNTGKRDGAEVVQAYVQQPAANGEPPHQLAAFAAVSLKTGESKEVTLSLNDRSFSVYDTSAHRWRSPAGTYSILVGSSSRDLPLHSSIEVKTH